MRIPAPMDAGRTAALRRGGRFAAAGLAAAFLAGPAQALSIVVPINQSLSSGGQYSGQFDISSYLAGSKVVSASVRAFGSDPYSPIVHVTPFGGRSLLSTEQVVVQEASSCVFGVCLVPEIVGVNRYFAEYRDIVFLDPRDVMVLDVGDGWGMAATSPTFDLGDYYYFASGPQVTNGSGGTDFLAYYERQVIDAYYGPLSAVATLNANDLAALNSDGVLDFSIFAQQGAFTANYAQLDFELAAVVPEPQTWALMILGFGGAGAMLRRARCAPAA